MVSCPLTRRSASRDSSPFVSGVHRWSARWGISWVLPRAGCLSPGQRRFNAICAVFDHDTFQVRRYGRIPGTAERILPEISRFLGIVVAMYYNDHEPPHFHARYGEHEIRVSIEPDFAVPPCYPYSKSTKRTHVQAGLPCDSQAWLDNQSFIGIIVPLNTSIYFFQF